MDDELKLAFRPLHFDGLAFHGRSNPEGTVTGRLPIRDMAQSLPQNTVKRISPPTFASRASWSAMIPFGVDNTEIPSPLFTRGRLFTEA